MMRTRPVAVIDPAVRTFDFDWLGMMRTRPVAVIDPAVRTFDFDWRVAFNAGIGIRVFLTRYLTIFGELRDYIYLEKLENLEVVLGADREEESTWIDENATLTNNFTIQRALRARGNDAAARERHRLRRGVPGVRNLPARPRPLRAGLHLRRDAVHVTHYRPRH
jgi:hypothetical protein